MVADPYFLNELVKVAENNSHIGILGPTVYEYKNPQEIQPVGAKIYWNKGEVINLILHESKYSDEREDVDCVIVMHFLQKVNCSIKSGI